MFIPLPLTQSQQANRDKLQQLYDSFMSAEAGTEEYSRAADALGEFVFDGIGKIDLET
jgi:hypothetical protein